MDNTSMWGAAMIGSLIGAAIVSMFTRDGIALFLMKWALSAAFCRIVLGIKESIHRKLAED